MRSDKLHHVLIAGDDEDLVPEIGGFASQSADDIVCLESLDFENRNVQRFE